MAVQHAPRSPSGAIFVATKLHIPVRRASLIPRDALVALLTGARDARLVLVAAPPGSGKTTLLAEWHVSPREDRPFAWLSLDPGDNDPVRFWTGVIEALRTVHPGIAEPAAAALQGAAASLGDVVLPLLINELAALDGPLVLVLDDYHVIRTPAIHAALEFLTDHLPPSVQLAIATRSDPPLPLPRLRVRGEMTEIRAADLRFSAAEATALLNGTLGLSLSADEVERLLRRTEGWAAGLQLAGLSLRGRPEPASFIASFAGDDRQIVDYLGSEVLDAQPPGLRRFLVRTSVLDRMCAPLCDAVTGEPGSAAALAELERSNLFTVPLDSRREWYRYHQLFRQLLLHQLSLEEPEMVAVFHRRAADWHEQEGLGEDAVRHALGAGDAVLSRDLVARHWSELFNQGRLATVSQWLDALPAQVVDADSRLWLARTWTTIDLGELDETRALLETADDAARRAWVALLQGLHRFKAGDVGAAARALRDIEHVGGEATAFWQTVACCLTGLTRYWTGDADGALEAFGEADRLAEGDDNGLATVYSLGYMALIHAQRESWSAARELVERVAGLVGNRPQLDEHFTALVWHLAAARLLAGDGRLDEAQDRCARAVDLARRGAGRLELGLALLEQAAVSGDRARRAELAGEAARICRECADPGVLPTLVADTSQPRQPPAHAPPAAGDLSARELGVLRLLDSELSLREIGSQLYVSLNTVKTHVRNIYMKLGVTTRGEAVERARERSLM